MRIVDTQSILKCCFLDLLCHERATTTIVETKQFVGSNVNVIIRQTCGQRSSMSTGSKRRAPENCFPMCIWYVFLILRCRGESDPRLYTTSVLSKGMPHCQIVTNCAVKYIFGSEVSPCSGILFANKEFVNRPRSQNMFPQFSFTF